MTEQTPDPETPASTTVEAVSLATETLGKDLLEALVMELQAAPDCWAKMTQLQQDQAIERMRKRVRTLVAESLHLLLAGSYSAVAATLGGVTFRKGIKVMMQINRDAPGRHELADAEGQRVLIIMANPDDYLARMEEIRARDKQGDLFNSGITQTENYTGGDDRPYRRDEPGTGGEELPTEIGPHVFDDPDDTGLCTICGQDSDAHPDPDALQLVMPPLWQQAKDALAIWRVVVTDEEAQQWTEEQMAAAMFWCQKMHEDQTNGPLRPKFLPSPLPPRRYPVTEPNRSTWNTEKSP